MSIYRSLNILYGIILKDHLDQFLKCYPYKITRSEDFRKRDLKIRLNFALIFLAHLKIIELWPWSILWSGERVRISKVQWITSNAVFGHPNILTENNWSGCILYVALGRHFFEKKMRRVADTTSVKTDDYWTMLINFV